MNDLTLLLVSEKDDKQGGLFQEYFHSFPGAVVTKNPHEDYESIDCLVIPCPSSFGHWKGHEIAEYYMGKIDAKTRERINRFILEQCIGELNPGATFLVKNKSKDSKYRYVAYVSLCRIAEGFTAPDYAYTAMRSVLLEVLRFNASYSRDAENGKATKKTADSDFIETVMVPSFAFGQFASTHENKKQVTRLMALAYRNMLYPIRHLPSSDEARILNVQIYEKVSETPAERKARAKEGLRSGELTTRGLYYEDELESLIEIIEQDNTDLRQQAAQALANFLHSSPTEFTLSYEAISSAIAHSKVALTYMLDEAESGNLNIFRTIPPSEIEFKNEIGNGTEAQVYKALWQGVEVAVKKFKGIPNSKEFQRELSIMSLVRHPNLVRCYGGYSDSIKDVYYLVMDLMDIDVNHALADSKWKIEYHTQLKIALHTARALEYLHACNLMHRDLKSVNLLIDSAYNAKVCDFGLSRVIAPNKKNMTGNVGTVSFIAPEVFENKPYDATADVYSFGMVMWELHTKQTPFADVNAFEIPMVVIRGDRPPIPKDMPKDYAKLMKSCWHKKASNRPPMNKIVKELTKIHKDQKLDAVAPSLDMSGERPFQLPVGGSTPNLLLHRIAPNLSRRSDSSPAFRAAIVGKDESEDSSNSKEHDDSDEHNAGGPRDGAATPSGMTPSSSSGSIPGTSAFERRKESPIKSRPSAFELSPASRRRTQSSAPQVSAAAKMKAKEFLNDNNASSPKKESKFGTIRKNSAGSPSSPAKDEVKEKRKKAEV